MPVSLPITTTTLKRGDIFTAATGSGFGGKPRPVLIVQADDYCASPRIIVALIESPVPNPPSTRLSIAPSQLNGLAKPSEIAVDLLVTVPWDKFGTHVGEASRYDMQRVDRAMLALLGLTIL